MQIKSKAQIKFVFIDEQNPITLSKKKKDHPLSNTDLSIGKKKKEKEMAPKVKKWGKSRFLEAIFQESRIKRKN